MLLDRNGFGNDSHTKLLIGSNKTLGNNLIVNSDFEGGNVNNWTKFASDETSTFAINSSSPISGTYDAKLAVTSAGTSTQHPYLRAAVSPDVSVSTYYSVSFDYKVNSGTCILDKIGDWFVLTTYPINETLSGSGTFELTIKTAGSITTKDFLFIYFRGTNTFEVQIDNVEVKAVNNPTTFTDTSKGGTTHTITANGDVHNSTTQKKFGTTSIYFDGTGDYLSIPDNEDWTFGSGDFTVDCWVYNPSFTSILTDVEQFIVHSDGYPQSDLSFFLRAYEDSGTNYISGVFTSNGSTGDVLTSTSNPAASTWHHVALIRNGNTIGLYINGVLEDSVTFTSSLWDSSQPLTIGSHADPGSYFSGYLDEVRISKGIARWTRNFTPPNRGFGAKPSTISTVTYYFDGYNAGTTTISNPDNAVDGSTSTSSNTGLDEEYTIEFNSNTSDGTNLGTITKVEQRVYYYKTGAPIVSVFPIFTGGNGDSESLPTEVTSGGAWSSYYDITADTNAPGTWSWTDVDNLGAQIDGVNGTGAFNLYKTEIRVTYLA